MSREDTEEDVYKFYLNNGNQKQLSRKEQEEIQHNNMRATVINEVSFDNQVRVQRAINIYQNEIKKDYDGGNNSATPTN